MEAPLLPQSISEAPRNGKRRFAGELFTGCLRLRGDEVYDEAGKLQITPDIE